MILTGGVSITVRELEYVFDATLNGWDENYGKYTRWFEIAFAQYVKTKHARSLSGGTQALTLAVATLDIGNGDEVIMPDLTYFACSDVVKLRGGVPVFVDILKDTWCIDPQAIEKAITSKTKAIMPVWMYGNAPEMDEIMKIAKKYNLYVIEDSCPAVGTFYKGKHAGTFGDFGCFSFHGAKIMTTGFGGMIITNDTKLYDKMQWLSDHGENKALPYRFWQTGIGYSFDLPNINCALGLAQVQRIEEFVEKKRKIFEWYQKRLSFPMNHEQHYTRTNKWLTSIIIPDRDKTMKELKKNQIDTRPFFFPISMFPMYKEQDTPNSYWAGLNGINLPSGIQRTEEEIDRICKVINDVTTD